jgi:hypothetical protein
LHTGASKTTVPIKLSPKSNNVLSPRTENEKAEGMIIYTNEALSQRSNEKVNLQASPKIKRIELKYEHHETGYSVQSGFTSIFQPPA